MRTRFRFKLATLLFLTALFACIAASVSHFGPFALFIGLVTTLIGTATGMLFGGSRIPSTWTRITAIMFLSLAILFASYGPATWMFATLYTADSRPEWVASTLTAIYRPVTHCVLVSPRPIRNAFVTYLSWWIPDEVSFHDWGVGIGWTSESKIAPGTGMTYTLLYLKQAAE